MAVTPPALPVCAQAASAPLYTARCTPTVAGTAPGAITVTLPGVGPLNLGLASARSSWVPATPRVRAATDLSTIPLR